MTHRNIALVGFMGSGKSVVGHTLAQRLAWKFVDIDAEIVHEQKKSIPALFKEQGEEPFRDIEEKVIERVCLGSNQVISTGGGALIRQSNIDCLRKNSWLVCLWVSAEKAFERVAGDKNRPLLQTSNPMQKIVELLNQREAHYRKADFIRDTSTSSIEEVVRDILRNFPQD